MRKIIPICTLGCVALISNVALAGVVFTSSFQSESTGASDPNFSGGEIVTSPNGTNFLADLGPGGSTTLTLTGLAPHTEVTLDFTLDAVGSLDGGPLPSNGGGPGDYFDVGYSSVSSSGNVFNYTFANFGCGETQSLIRRRGACQQPAPLR